MKGKACSAEFMRRLERMGAVHEGKHKDLVKFISHQTCISASQVQRLVNTFGLREKIRDIADLSEDPYPSIFIECLSAPDPEALAIKAIEEE